jgi:hypothetical protein
MYLLSLQQDFALKVARLILIGSEIGLPVTFGDAYRDPRLHGVMGTKIGYGAANSCHKLRLAVDLNIIKNGKIASDCDYEKLHDEWDKLGGAERIKNDLNHFSFRYGDFR